jgi:hypothetical protein
MTEVHRAKAKAGKGKLIRLKFDDGSTNVTSTSGPADFTLAPAGPTVASPASRTWLITPAS